MSTKQVIVVRKDLNMRKGKMISQGAHASMAFITRNINSKDNVFSAMFNDEQFENIYSWLKNSFVKICVSVNSEKELLEIYQKAKDAGLLVELIIDNGKTEFNGVPTPTCLAIGPDKNEEIDKITGDLKLL